MTPAILDPLPTALSTPAELPEHIAVRIEVRYVSEEDVEGPCWVWTGITNDRGYGQLKRSGRVVTIHRTVFELLVGPIPAGLEVGQSCLVRACCSPAHLMTATRAEHTRRRKAAASRFCVKGHPRMLENLLVLSRDADGDVERETCRPCVQPRPRVQLPGVTAEVAATAALVAAWT